MEALYPAALNLPFTGASGGSYLLNVPFRGVIHTTESKDYHPSQTLYFNHRNPPHFTVVKKGAKVNAYQHYSINVAARALANPKKEVDDVQTNRMAAIQIEICWTAKTIATLPVEIKDALRPLMRWIEAETGIQRTTPKFFDEDQAVGAGAASRMSTKKWTEFNGWCGHQHVPENEHWDPGLIDIAYLLT
jgi:hypothetical protein